MTHHDDDLPVLPLSRFHRPSRYAARPAGGQSDPFFYEPFVPGDEVDGAARDRRASRVEAVRWAIRNLPDRQRECITLHMQGLAGREISDRLGITEQAVSQALSRAKAKLAEDLADLVRWQPYPR